MSPAHTREYAHELIDQMPPEQISYAIQLLQEAADPFLQALRNAPFEDEEISEEEEQAAAEARVSHAAGRSISNAELLQEFGLTEGDFDRLGETAPIQPQIILNRG